ncbi:MAG: hypothetical protein ACR2F5_03830 [Candidatus Limnocylindria bacterium]
MSGDELSKSRLDRMREVMGGHVERGEVPGTAFSVLFTQLHRLATSYWMDPET